MTAGGGTRDVAQPAQRKGRASFNAPLLVVVVMCQ
jgi:hypothetical protein